MVVFSFPKILALDFDGVICDGLLEYFQTTKRSYDKIWANHSSLNLDNFANHFYQLRPVIETGWEMPILLRSLVLGYSVSQIEENWLEICSQIIQQETLDKKYLMEQLDGVRDNWIETDLENWLKLHRFYPGILERLAQIIDSSTQLYIVTTKEGRFVKQLLQQQGLEIPEKNIFGKEVKQPKYETLRHLLRENSAQSDQLWFVEDLLKTLQTVHQQPDLTEVKLFLADWGYNLPKTRNLIQEDTTIYLLSLEKLSQDFSNWI